MLRREALNVIKSSGCGTAMAESDLTPEAA